MAVELDRRRRSRAISLAAVAVLAAGVAWLAARPPATGPAPPPGGAPAIVRAERLEQARAIVITTAEGEFTLARTAAGWALRDRGDFPAPEARVAELEAALAALRLMRPMTRDPQKHDRLFVGDPTRGGKGVLVQIQDERGAYLVDLVLGFTPRGLYARRRGDDQAWAARGALPAFTDPAFWLNIEPLALDAGRFVRLDVAPSEGPAFSLLRDAPGGPFRAARPFAFRAIRHPDVAQTLAVTLATLAPKDIAPAPSIVGAPIARLVASADDGLVVAVDLHRKDGADWAKVTARTIPDAPADTLARAQALNAQAGPWAYRVSSAQAAALAPTLMALTGVEEAAPAPRAAPVPASPPPRPRPEPEPIAAAQKAPTPDPAPQQDPQPTVRVDPAAPATGAEEGSPAPPDRAG